MWVEFDRVIIRFALNSVLRFLKYTFVKGEEK